MSFTCPSCQSVDTVELDLAIIDCFGEADNQRVSFFTDAGFPHERKIYARACRSCKIMFIE